jgi:hypothetical protein
MNDTGQSAPLPSGGDVSPPNVESEPRLRGQLIRWLIILFVGLGIALTPVPAGITVQSW